MTDDEVYVVDDDESVRDSIGVLLDSLDMKFRTFASADEFLNEFDASKGGCLVLDIRMPGMSGLELQERLLERGQHIPIVFITGHGDIPMAVEAMRRGAVDFIRKPFRDQELIDRINEGLGSNSTQKKNEQVLEAARTAVETLTPRENEVFAMVCEGKANKVIAIDLGISERTVEIHRSQVMHKTGSRSLAELVRLKLALEVVDVSGAVT